MTLAQVKTQLGVAAFNLGRCKDEQGNPTKFLRHWDAKNRFALVIHEELLAHIKVTPAETKLALKWKQAETKERYEADGVTLANPDTSGLAYDSYVLIKSDNIEDSI
jgi:hypothetical protein